MANTLYLMDMASIMVGDDNPDEVNFINIEDVTIPVLQEKTVDHTGGGAIMGIEIGMNMLDALSLSFKLKGFNPHVSKKLGIGQARRLNYTIRGNVRDIREDRQFACRIRVLGRMVKMDQGSFSRDSGTSEDYEIKEVVHYECFFDGVEKFFFDYFRGPAGARVDGNPIFATAAANLGLL